MNNSEIASLSLVEYVDFLEGMASMNASSVWKVNFDYFFWYGVVSEERFEEAKLALGFRKALGEYYAGLSHS